MNLTGEKKLSQNKDLLHAVARDMVYAGNPHYFYDVRDWQETAEIIKYCHDQKIPLTVCGSQTSMTGSSVADSGVALKIPATQKIIDITKKHGSENGRMITEPGVILGDLKQAALQQGFFYPPDPTSQNEAQIGSTVATNATGEDTFKYGPTRRYVQEIELLCADGATKIISRKKPCSDLIMKNKAGYFLDGEEIDQVIGSEGTLGVIKKITLSLLPNRYPDQFLILLPFSNLSAAMRAVMKIVDCERRPRALELIGPGAAEYFRQHQSCPEELKKENCFLYLKEEVGDHNDRSKVMDYWYGELKKVYADLGEEKTFSRIYMATTDLQKKAIRECRHYVPLKVNEEYFPYREKGGGKVGTDWWVPVHHLHQMMTTAFNDAEKIGIPFLVFAHIGNGHPHWNFLTRNADEYAKAKSLVLAQCRQAVLFGGGVAGEHGIGKIKRDLLSIQHAPKVIKKMMQLKMKWDPYWILGRGNILAYSSDSTAS